MSKPLRIVVIHLVLLLVAACGSAPPAPIDRFYRLPEPQAASTASLVNGVLRVRPIRAEGVHAERAILTMTSPDSLHLEQERYAFWVDAPPRLVQAWIVGWLRSAGAADMVVNETVRESDMELRGRIISFERILDGGDSRVALGLELRLDNALGKPVLLRNYRRSVEVDGRGISAAAEALATALDAVLVAFMDDARAALATTP